MNNDSLRNSTCVSQYNELTTKAWFDDVCFTKGYISTPTYRLTGAHGLTRKLSDSGSQVSKHRRRCRARYAFVVISAVEVAAVGAPVVLNDRLDVHEGGLSMHTYTYAYNHITIDIWC
jgi:hypothetical protein